MKPVKVMIVDDSATVRQVLSALLAADPALSVIATASDPLYAMERMAREWPDVIVLDVEMPRMDGISFLRRLMRERPTPVVICSTLTEQGAETTMQALAAGAVSVIAKPKLGLRQFLVDSGDDLAGVIKAAARANLGAMAAKVAAPAPPSPRLSADAVLPAAAPAPVLGSESVVGIGTSTGGTQALEYVLGALPRVCPGIVIVQHMPKQFTGAFARRLDQLCQIEVREAQDGDRVLPGRALIAPGGRHLVVQRSGAQYRVEIKDAPPVNRHRPSVDVLFRSLAHCAGRNALGVIMTGMGDDGARGLREMRDAGAHTIAQDEASCVVYGMPKEAVKRDAARSILPLRDIPAAVAAAGRHHR
ncbi:protein-glutamate methylesterase/protein-glutamine glutaminase [Duganella radicis]|uniref:Protein-glutamate methylesterase/protein-glutamine glutaminase n=1 Tax=Duganella radicis TaxID=551988 RepID=A0A6L6PSL2_9BURK|nr:chemotaxis response regulator protein-glutamate methylesterase [Duganella radicis]MTV41824.1 chemotaxis-specific protein-glutamate methyltransferase CheB [Duganella radicis]